MQKNFATLSAAIHPYYDLVQCGTPVNEPTCVPSRPNEYSAITVADADGDGIPNDGTDKGPAGQTDRSCRA